MCDYMTENITKDSVKEQLATASVAVEALKKELAAADKKKEDSFKKKQEVGSKIAEKIRLVNESKKERNELTQQVRDLKKRRDELNSQINERVQEIKKLTDGKPLPKRSRKDPEGPQSLKKKIEQLEFKMETQPMGFDAEQKINKEIRDLKKQYNEKMKAFDGLEDVMVKSREIDALKKEANELHAKVTKLATDSQKRHESLINQSKEIEDLKKEEEQLYNDFLEHKKVFAELNTKLRNQLGIADEVKDVVRKERQTSKKAKEAEDQKTLKERANEAEQKLKKKQKLTTEDLLAMQGMK